MDNDSFLKILFIQFIPMHFCQIKPIHFHQLGIFNSIWVGYNDLNELENVNTFDFMPGKK